MKKPSYNLWCKITEQYYFPLGAYLCGLCYKNIDSLSDDVVEKDDFVDPEFNPSFDDLKDEYRLEARHKLNGILEKINLSPIRYQHSQKNWDDYSTKTHAYGRKKFLQYIEKQKHIFAEGFAPNDPAGFLRAMQDQFEDDDELTLSQLKTLYSSAITAKGKFGVLTIAARTISKSVMVDAFGCSSWQVSKAKEIVNLKGLCELPDDKTIKRIRMDPNLIQHFIDYLFESGSLMTAAYGTNTFVYENGEKQIVPKSVLTGVRSQICASYIIFCNEVGLLHLGSTSLMKILTTLKPAPRTQLFGLDNVLVDGEEALEDLIEILEKIDFYEKDEMTKILRRWESYQKTNFVMRCQENADILSHCTVCALSDPKEETFSSICNKEHNKRCPDCDILIDTLM